MITGTKWKVMPCPVHGGKHPYHDHRWIVTDDAEVEHGSTVQDWRIAKGSLIALMMDVPPENAKLIASAPELLARSVQLRQFVNRLKNSDNPFAVSDVLRRADLSNFDEFIRKSTT